MHIQRVRLCNFCTFGPAPTEIQLGQATYFTGVDREGRASVLRALSLLFSSDEHRIGVSEDDFYSLRESDDDIEQSVSLWIEVDLFLGGDFNARTQATEHHFYAGEQSAWERRLRQWRMRSKGGQELVRFRLAATIDVSGAIVERLTCVLRCGKDGAVLDQVDVDGEMRNAIQVHQIRARDSDGDGSYAVDVLDRMLRGLFLSGPPWVKHLHVFSSISQDAFKSQVLDDLDAVMQELLVATSGLTSRDSSGDVGSVSRGITTNLLSPRASIERMLLCTSPYRALLVLSIAIHEVAEQEVKRAVHESRASVLQRPALTLILLEDPELALSDEQVRMAMIELARWLNSPDAQLITSTESLEVLRGVSPERVRVSLRRDGLTEMLPVWMPPNRHERKFVLDTLRTFPQIYLARAVILCESTGVELIIRKLIKAHGLSISATEIAVVPLGSAQVSVLQRVFSEMGLNYFALLDMHDGRDGGGREKIVDVAQQFGSMAVACDSERPEGSGTTRNTARRLRNYSELLEALERLNIFFAAPFDFDFMMLRSYPNAYQIGRTELRPASPVILNAVFGERATDFHFFSPEDMQMLWAYHRRFQREVGLSSHMQAAESIDEGELVGGTPEVLYSLLLGIQRSLASWY